MAVTYQMGTSPLIASLFAGPVFAGSLGLATLILSTPAPIPVNIAWGDIPPLLVVTVSMSFFGFIVGVLPCLIGSIVMGNLGSQIASFRQPFAWTIAGAAIPGLLFLAPLLSSDDPTSADSAWFYGLVMTGAVCSALCRKGAKWIPYVQSTPRRLVAHVTAGEE